ncbi:hypothetical protein ACIPMZ_16505 [Scandinavium goeteborgense]|uniref:hypothetical protein n=1 Tax=Scandinavium goeteborgense TaxID=1851514 RepID=UPI00380EDC37
MKCTVLSENNYLSAGIEALFHSMCKKKNFGSVVFIDVMSPPIISDAEKLLISAAELVVFIVDSTSNFRILEDNLLVWNKGNVVFKYIFVSAQTYEFKDLLKWGGNSLLDGIKHPDDFNENELGLITHICTGQPIYGSDVYQAISKKTLSVWKRSVMRKLNVSTDAKLYKVIRRFSYLNQILSHVYI